MKPSLKVAIVQSESLARHGGISRVLAELMNHWNQSILCGWAQLETRRLPIFRSYPIRMNIPRQANILYLPRTGGSTALKSVKIPGVVTVHDVGFWDCKEDVAALGWRKLMVLPHFKNLEYATRIITVSRFTAERLQVLLPYLEPKIRVVHLGVSRVFIDWDKSYRESLHLAAGAIPNLQGDPLIIYAGDDAPRKNLPLLLQVFREVKRVHPKAQLLKVGRAKLASDRTRTMGTCKVLGLVPNQDVLFLDDVPDPLLAALYRSADVFVSASMYEGFGLPPLEAMAVGTPSVVTDQGAFPEVVGGHAFIVQPTLRAMTRATLSAIATPRPERKTADLKGYAGRFTWAKTAQQYTDVFLDALGTTAKDFPISTHSL